MKFGALRVKNSYPQLEVNCNIEWGSQNYTLRYDVIIVSIPIQSSHLYLSDISVYALGYNMITSTLTCQITKAVLRIVQYATDRRIRLTNWYVMSGIMLKRCWWSEIAHPKFKYVITPENIPGIRWYYRPCK